MRASLVTKLLAAYLAPMLALVVLAPLVGWAVARRGMEEEVGRRLAAGAAAAATSIRAELLQTLQPGDEGTRTYRNLLTRLEAMKAAAGVERLYVFDRERRLLVGTGEVPPIGTFLPQLERDRLEIDRALAAGGAPTASQVTFVGLDGRTYTSGYAPLVDGDGRVVAAVGADAPADFFTVLRRVGLSMAALAAAAAAAGLLLFWAAGSRWLLAPIRRLRGAAERIGGGDLASPVPVPVTLGGGGDELAALAAGMERMRAQLFARERELQLMLAGIAHEVRNPLGGIELFAGLLAEDLRDDPEKLEHVRKVQRELRHLARLVEDFLGYARQPRLSRGPVDLGALLEEVAELHRPDAEARGVRLEVVAAAAAPASASTAGGDVGAGLTAEADAGALRRALINLVRNALQASPRGGCVRLTAELAGAHARLSVRDEGEGVPAELRAQIFAPFFTTKEQGLGLGLALVRRIAEAHGGTARLEPPESAAAGRGACFVVEIPRVAPAEPMAPDAAAPTRPGPSSAAASESPSSASPPPPAAA